MNRLYVFTSTGNCLHSAGIIAGKLPEIEVVSIAAEMKKDTWSIEGDKAGFIFPCYYGTVPRIVKEFVEGAERVSCRYGYAFVSAGRETGMSIPVLRDILQARGAELHYARSLRHVSNYMNGWYYSSLYPRENEKAKILANADSAVRNSIRDIQNEAVSIEKGSRLGYIMPQMISPARYCRDTRPWDSEFSVSDDCSGCGTCAKACPVGNISMNNGRPVFAHNCQRCMGCIQFCPKQAFSINNKPMKKQRYSHPAVSIKDLASFHAGEELKLTAET